VSKRRPNFKSPMNRARDATLQFVLRPFRWFSPRNQFLILFGILVVVTTLLLWSAFPSGFNDNYRVGDIVKTTVISPADIEGILDTRETERRRAAALESARPVFDYSPSLPSDSAQSFRKGWEDLKQQAETRNVNGGEPVWHGEGNSNVSRAIIAHKFNSADLDRLTEVLQESEASYIYEDGDAGRLKQEIELVDLNNAERVVIPAPLNQMTALSVARRHLASHLSQFSGWSQEQQAALVSAMTPLIKTNVAYDESATQAARQAALEKVPPVTISLKRNQVIAREGDTVTETILSQFAAIRTYGHSARPLNRLIGLLVMVTALFWASWKFTEHRGKSVNLALGDKKAFSLVGSAVVVETILMRIGFTLSDSLAAQSTRAPLDDPTIWNFAIPFAAAALLVAMLVDTHLALITSLITALFAALLAPAGVLNAFYAVISCAAAIYGIGRYRERQSVTLAGLFVGATNGIMALALIAFSQRPMTLNVMLLTLGCGVAGGLLTTIFTAGGLPINESLFGILTDVKLLELSNADLPVLGQLALRAPGTNQHSHAVGQLAEDACRAVGANPLLARIGALYHDIGKLAAPEYFVENQRGRNPHDRLRPSQSARIITSHVNYGLRLAKEIGLPNAIADFIPQHHGTRTLHFFLRKAQAHAADGEQVNESEFRYPGPKPQFKEAAIMMLADSCEAAARSLARPDPENIRSIVSKIVDAVISDGQLDECDITLRELTIIRESMITALTAIYHARIDYPGYNPPALTGSLPPLPHAHLDTEERGITYSKASEIPINKSGEVEDEAVTRGQ
jgi:putative nucleotidyltransferase with HDIG domain